jgi:hypothetical protein
MLVCRFGRLSSRPEIRNEPASASPHDLSMKFAKAREQLLLVMPVLSCTR